MESWTDQTITIQLLFFEITLRINMVQFKNGTQTMQTFDEENFYLIEINENGAKKHYLSLFLPDDFDGQEIPQEAIIGRLKTFDPSVKPPFTSDNFVVNLAFIKFLHEVIKHRGSEDPELIAVAQEQGEGMGIMADRRCIKAGNLEREDVIGAFEIKNGKIIPESYEENESYEVNSEKGFMILGSWLEGVLLEEIESKYG